MDDIKVIAKKLGMPVESLTKYNKSMLDKYLSGLVEKQPAEKPVEPEEQPQ